MKLHLLLFILFFSNLHLTYSQQRFKRFNYVDGLSVTPNFGIGSVGGELGDILHFKPVFGLNLDKGLSEKVNLNLDFVGGVLNGEGNNIYIANFQSDFFQIQLYSTLNLSRLFYEKRKRLEFKPYLGFGLIWFHTKVYDSKTNIFLRTTSDGSTKHTALFQQTGVGVGEKGIFYTRELVIPFGCNISYTISDKLSLSTSFGYNFVYNDKLDGTTPYNLTNPYIIGGVNSYSDTANDGWFRFSFGIKYIISSFITENARGV